MLDKSKLNLIYYILLLQDGNGAKEVVEDEDSLDKMQQNMNDVDRHMLEEEQNRKQEAQVMEQPQG